VLVSAAPLLALAAPLLGGWAAAGAPGGPAGGAPAPAGRDTSGLIAFVNDEGQVAVVDPATLEVTAYGAGPRQAIFPAWSSDGTKVAAVVAALGGSWVEVVDVSRGGDPVVVLSAPDRNPIYLNWSPDDRYLAVLSSTPGEDLALDIVDVARALAGDREAARTALEQGQPFYWVWSPTGRSVLVHRDVLRESALVGMSPIDSFAVASPLPAPGAFQSPAISDSGRYVAYARHDLGGDRVVVLANPERGPAGAPVAELAHEGLVAFAWRPGHDHLSVQGATTPGYFAGPVVLIEVPDGEARVLSSDVVVGSFWSPDGRWLATLSLEEDGGGGRVADAPAGSVPGAPPGLASAAPSGGLATAYASEAAAAPGGLAHVQARVPLLTVKFVDAEAGDVVDAGEFLLSRAFLTQYLPFFDQYSRSHSLWSPDSSALVLPVVGPEGRVELVAVRVDGGSSEVVAGDMPAWNLR
jgi:dipeptidyl aminopeptidase/acylaminoacyl peptidase